MWFQGFRGCAAFAPCLVFANFQLQGLCADLENYLVDTNIVLGLFVLLLVLLVVVVVVVVCLFVVCLIFCGLLTST